MHMPRLFHLGDISRAVKRQSSNGSSTSSVSTSSMLASLSLSSINMKLSDSTTSLDSAAGQATHYCVKLSNSSATISKNGTNYEGEVDANGSLSGHGIMRNTQFVYAGQWAQSKPHGYGVLYNMKARTLYEGEFHEGRANGYGRLVIYSPDGESSNDRYMYGYFQQGRFNRRRSLHARSDREKSIQHTGTARRAAALAAGESSKAMQKALREAHTATTTACFHPYSARASVCVSLVNEQPPVISMGPITSFLAYQIAAH